MKIGGPKKPPDVVPSTPPPAKEGPAGRFDLEGGAESPLVKAAPTSNVGEVIADLLHQLRNEGLSGAEAAEKMVDRIVEIRGAHLEPPQKHALQESLLAMLRSDPLLAEKLRRLDEAED